MVDIEKEIITDELRSKKIVCVDPGCCDLIYCGSKDENDKLQTFRYTQNQRRLETRTKKYRYGNIFYLHEDRSFFICAMILHHKLLMQDYPHTKRYKDNTGSEVVTN